MGVGKVLASNSKMHLLFQYCIVVFSSMFICPSVNRVSLKLAEPNSTGLDLFGFSDFITVVY